MLKGKGFGMPLEVIILLAIGGILYGLAVIWWRSCIESNYELRVTNYERKNNAKD